MSRTDDQSQAAPRLGNCAADSCGATPAEYDKWPCLRAVCPMRDALRTCAASGQPIPAAGIVHIVGHGGAIVGSGDNRRLVREGATVCDGCWEPDPPDAPIKTPTVRMRQAPEHFYTAAAQAWARVQGDQIDAMDDQLRAAVGAVLDLVDEPPAPRVVDVDSLAIEGLTEEQRRDFLDSPEAREAVAASTRLRAESAEVKTELAHLRVELSRTYHERDTARVDAANLRDLIRDIRIACLGAQFPSDGDHEKAWAAFDKAGIDERGIDGG